ncbi:hypothetical protein BP5796_02156 [Coleophoma crateriformis]|uniref:Thioesterase family protein n=1 Tax=Coleophoma crateriformis TaxID=565419 RepID=A0A3D8SXU5_9HELO|nr:hypothetical protein BP5796_02156 [Coleophoma crateriformis]
MRTSNVHDASEGPSRHGSIARQRSVDLLPRRNAGPAVQPASPIATTQRLSETGVSAWVVPHGGYVMSAIATAVQSHFALRQPSLDQPDLVTYHTEYLARTTPGPADVVVTELKLGRQFSVVRAQLVQYPAGDPSQGPPRLCVEALVTQGNLARERRSGGLSLPTRDLRAVYQIPPREAFEAFPIDPRFAAHAKLEFSYAPGTDAASHVHPTLGPSVREQWVRWSAASPGSRGFTPLALPFLADAWRPLPQGYGLQGKWYPTLNYGLEIKRLPPSADGWAWLFVRVEMHMVQDGRFDMSCLIFDEQRELVALGNQVALVVGAERNGKAIGAKL